MRPELFRIPVPDWLNHMFPGLGHELPVHSYGVMLMIGFLAALQLAKFLARRHRIDPEVFVNAGLVALVSGIAGARLSHVLENFSYYTNPARSAWANFSDAINIGSGGLTFYGGFLLAFGCTVIYGLMKKVPVRRGMDIVAPCLMVGLAFGRIGCLLNGCCYGAECNLPWGISYPYASNAYQEEMHNGEIDPPAALKTMTVDGRLSIRPLADVKADPVLAPLAAAARSKELHPAQIYSTITAFLIAGICVCYLTLRPPPGRVFAVMLMIESPSRFILEMLRAEPAVIGRGTGVLNALPPMSFSMVLSVGLLFMGICLWYAFADRASGSRTEMVRPAAIA